MRLRPTFLAALVLWAACFVLISRTGTWGPLAVLGPLLAAVELYSAPDARRLLRPSARLLALGLAGAAVMTAATYALFGLFAQLLPALRPLTLELYHELRAPSFTPAERAALIPLVAAAEEILFRGAALPDGGPLPPVLVNAVLVGAAHLSSGNWLLALVAALCGAAWGGMRVVTRSCVPGIVTHVFWDLAILVARPLI